jgi:hypothetical protein
MTGIEALIRLKIGLKARRNEWEEKQYAYVHTITRKDGTVHTGVVIYKDVPNGGICSHVPVRYVEASELLKDDWEIVE